MSYCKRAAVPIVVMIVMLSTMAGFWLHSQTTRAAAPAVAGCGQWTLMPGANPGTVGSSLNGVAAISANDVWAVGDKYGQTERPLSTVFSTLIEHWNGAQWRAVASPNISNVERNMLWSVAAVSPTDVWAVGYEGNETSGAFSTLTEHWNGSAWNTVPSVNLGSDDMLTSVSADASNDVWAVGSLIERWNGDKWSVVPNGSTDPSAFLTSVTALSPTNAWAVGEHWDTSFRTHQTLIEHWNGTNWNVVSSPSVSPGDNVLQSVTAVGPNDIWAIGTVGAFQSSTLIEHWNGTNWAVARGYTDGTNGVGLNAAAVVPGSQQILAVGDESATYGGVVGLAVRWNGMTWMRMPTSDQAHIFPGLTGVAVVSASDAWAVGTYWYSSYAATFPRTRPSRTGLYPGPIYPQSQVLIEHYVAPAHGIVCG